MEAMLDEEQGQHSATLLRQESTKAVSFNTQVESFALPPAELEVVDLGDSASSPQSGTSKSPTVASPGTPLKGSVANLATPLQSSLQPKRLEIARKPPRGSFLALLFVRKAHSLVARDAQRRLAQIAVEPIGVSSIEEACQMLSGYDVDWEKRTPAATSLNMTRPT